MTERKIYEIFQLEFSNFTVTRQIHLGSEIDTHHRTIDRPLPSRPLQRNLITASNERKKHRSNVRNANEALVGGGGEVKLTHYKNSPQRHEIFLKLPNEHENIFALFIENLFNDFDIRVFFFSFFQPLRKMQSIGVFQNHKSFNFSFFFRQRRRRKLARESANFQFLAIYYRSSLSSFHR